MRRHAVAMARAQHQVASMRSRICRAPWVLRAAISRRAKVWLTGFDSLPGRKVGRLSHLEARCGDPVAALDHLTLAIRNYHNSGNTTTIRIPLVVLAALLDRLGR
jgi:hypothetical protein